MQESFLRAFSAFETFRGEEAKSWLLAIVRNTCMTWMKRNRNGAEAFEFDERVEDPSAPAPDPEALLVISCNREQVRKALEQLPPDFREALVLREFEDLSYKEIAASTGVPVGTVMSRLARGRDWMRRVLSSPAKEPA